MNRPNQRPTLGSSAKAAIGTSLVGGAISALGSRSGRPNLGQLVHTMRHRFPTVAITGMTGVGKTRLADRLARRSSVNQAQGEQVGSATMERRTRRTSRLHGYRFRVVPGDNAATRLGALDEVFHDEPVDGILHVVAYGHATPRRAGGTTGTGEASREEQLAAELEDWSITAHRVAAMAVRREKPVWLIIVVTKTDLFPDQIDEAVRYYSPGSGSAFGRKLDELRALAGGARLSIDVLPVCAEGGDKNSPMPSKECTRLLGALETRMAQLSGHV